MEPRLRVLLVDDEPDIRTLLRRFIDLRGDGLEVVGEAGDGVDGLARWRQLQPDVIVLDQRMPLMTGLEMARYVRSERVDQTIVLFTAHDDAATRAEAEEVGITRFLRKGDWDLVVSSLHELLDAR